LIALFFAEGLGYDSDGILGLSPHKNPANKKFHFLWVLKNSGIITESIVSFSLTRHQDGRHPYALFGGFNESQIVGGSQGLITVPSYTNSLETWALEG
jgi:hypothetical protein